MTRVDRPSSRRRFLAGLVALPAVVAGGRLATAARRAARAFRPPGRGASASRCAICGAVDHRMLQCPRTPEVL